MGFASDDQKLIEKYLKQIDAEPYEIEDLPAGQFLLIYPFGLSENEQKSILKKLKDGYLDPDFAEDNSLEKMGYLEHEIGEDDTRDWWQVQIYPNWSDNNQLLDDNDNPIEIKSIKSGVIKMNNEIRQAVRSRIIAAQQDDQELRSAIRKLVASKIKKIAEGEMLTPEDAKEIFKEANTINRTMEILETTIDNLLENLKEKGYDKSPNGTLAKRVFDELAIASSQIIGARIGGDKGSGMWAVLNITSGENDGNYLITHE